MLNINELERRVQLAKEVKQLLGPGSEALVRSLFEDASLKQPIQPGQVGVPANEQQYCRLGHDTFVCGRDNDKNRTCKRCRKIHNQNYQSGLRTRYDNVLLRIKQQLTDSNRSGSMVTEEDIEILNELKDLKKSLNKTKKYLLDRVDNSKALNHNKARARKAIRRAQSFDELINGSRFALDKYYVVRDINKQY